MCTAKIYGVGQVKVKIVPCVINGGTDRTACKRPDIGKATDESRNTLGIFLYRNLSVQCVGKGHCVDFFFLRSFLFTTAAEQRNHDDRRHKQSDNAFNR